MSTEFRRAISTPLGDVLLCADADGLTALCFDAQEAAADEHPLLLLAEAQLQEYFAGRRRRFSVPLSIHGSEFQRQVWRALMQIPYGTTVSYRAIAAAIGNPKACRAVGMANHANSLPIFIPCHRVVGANGRLTGYAGGLEIKRFLLELEQSNAEV